VLLWDAQNNSGPQRFAEMDDKIENVGFSQDGKLLAVGGAKWIHVWDIDSRTCIGSFQAPHHEVLRALAFSPDKKLLLTHIGEVAQIWDWRRGVKIFESDFFPGSMAISPDGSLLVLGEKVLSLRSTEYLREFCDISEGQHYSDGKVFSPDGNFLALNMGYRGVVVVNVKTVIGDGRERIEICTANKETLKDMVTYHLERGYLRELSSTWHDLRQERIEVAVQIDEDQLQNELQWKLLHIDARLAQCIIDVEMLMYPNAPDWFKDKLMDFRVDIASLISDVEKMVASMGNGEALARLREQFMHLDHQHTALMDEAFIEALCQAASQRGCNLVLVPPVAWVISSVIGDVELLWDIYDAWR